MNKPDLSIVIVHCQTPNFLKMCLGSIFETLSGINYELIIVDSLSSSGTRNLIKERAPGAKLIFSATNLGYARGVNMGIKQAEGNFVLALNPDIILTSGSVEQLLAYIQAHPDIGILAPQLRNFNGTVQRSYFRYYQPLTVIARRSFLKRFSYFRKIVERFLMTDTDQEKIQTPDWIMGSILLVSKQVIAKVGLIDESFFMYFEDVDWARRFWQNGFKVVYYPKVFAYHYHQRESKSGYGIFDVLINRKTRWHISSAAKFFLKYRNLSRAANLSSS